MMTAILPTPKRVTFREALMPLRHGDGIAAVSASALPAARWLQQQLHEQIGVECDLAAPGRPGKITIGLVDEFGQAGVAQSSWRGTDVFKSALGQEQGYVLDVTEQQAILAAAGPAGLLHAAASLLQLVESDSVVQCGHLADYPDFRFRVADWLLNVEANRWGYERGDGPTALFQRLRRKIDLAARYKLNVIWFDGFGWGLDRAPGYAEAVRGLARHARSRGIRLAHGGYGGGYGFAYQESELYSAPYMGEVFENRRPYPHGQAYDCIGEPSHEASWRYGTCLSNEGLLEAKLAELVTFVKACEPGLLYIHDIDIGSWDPAVEAWQRRCSECRQRWPNDDAAAEDGMAGAYAAWFGILASAVGQVRSDDGDYVAARDCELVFVGPVYTHAEEPDRAWEAECTYFQTVSRLIGPAPNVQFGLREQLLSDREPRLRVAELSEQLRAIGNGHGVFVVCFAGSDAYYSDQLVGPAATLNRYFEGAETVYVVGLGAVAEPGQIVAAEYAWNTGGSGAAASAGSRQEAFAQLEAARTGRLRPEELYGAGGLLEQACRQLYGHCAGPLLAELLGPQQPESRPVPMIWHTITREVRRLRAGDASDPRERRDYWLARQQATTNGAALVRRALDCDGLEDPVREDLSWFRRCLEAGELFCAALARMYEALHSPRRGWRADFDELCARLEARMPPASDCGWFDPLGGDVGVWGETLGLLRSSATRLG